jgi:4-hydroxybutyrate dehydrogenase
MQQFKIIPQIAYFDTVAEFVRAFEIGERDLIVTRRSIRDTFLAPLNVKSSILFRADYGEGEPNDEMIDKMKADLQNIDYDRMIAIGGGSVLDTCKILALDHPGKTEDLFTGEATAKKVKPLIAVPTTPGTGSEVSNTAVVNLTRQGLKKGFGTPDTYPDTAVLIPETNIGLPFDTFRASSVDMFITACESYLSPKATLFSDLYAEKAIRMLLPAYQILAKEGPDARDAHMKEFVLASCFAGISFANAGVGAVHALAYSIGGAFHVVHGQSTYAFFLATLRKYDEKSPDGKIRALKNLFAQELNGPEENTFETLGKLLSKIMPTKPLCEYGMRTEQIEAFTDSTLENQQRLLVNSYVPLLREDILDIFTVLYSEKVEYK